MIDFITALGLAIAMEGALYALFPDGMKRVMTEVLTQPIGNLRVAGLAAVVIGVFVVWLVKG